MNDCVPGGAGRAGREGRVQVSIAEARQARGSRSILVSSLIQGNVTTDFYDAFTGTVINMTCTAGMNPHFLCHLCMCVIKIFCWNDKSGVFFMNPLW